MIIPEKKHVVKKYFEEAKKEKLIKFEINAKYLVEYFQGCNFLACFDQIHHNVFSNKKLSIFNLRILKYEQDINFQNSKDNPTYFA